MKFCAVTLMVHGPGRIDDMYRRSGVFQGCRRWQVVFFKDVIVFHFGHGFSRGAAYGFISSSFSGPFEAQAERPLPQRRLKLQG
jgi:hypothetical protein